MLSKLDIPNNALHLGWSIEFNYKILCVRRPQFAILCDINRRVFTFFDLFKTLLLKAETPHELLEVLKESLKEHKDDFFFARFTNSLSNVMESYTAWLSDPDNFAYLKTMYVEERIIHVVLNAMDEDNRFMRLNEWIKSSGYTLDTLYLSNIGMWVNYEPPFLSNLSQLMDENVIYLDSYRKPGHGLTLRATFGSIPPP
jgi:hypothetical protein